MAKGKLGKQRETKIVAKLTGGGGEKSALKAVLYFDDERGTHVIAQSAVRKGVVELDMSKIDKKLPETMKLVVLPQEIEHPNHIRRFAEAEFCPPRLIKRGFIENMPGIIDLGDIVFRPVHPSLFGTRTVCGRVIKRDPVTGEITYVAGAKVSVYDVDYNLLWYYPYSRLLWCWLFPLRIFRKELIGVTTTDECGRFCVDIPKIDIDAVVRLRKRLRCVFENLLPPRIIDLIERGIKPPPGPYPWFRGLADELPLLDKQRSAMALGGMTGAAGGLKTLRSAASPTPMREGCCGGTDGAGIHRGSGMFGPVEEDQLSYMNRIAFPDSVPPPDVIDRDRLNELLAAKKLAEKIGDISRIRPIVRLLRCWFEYVPEMSLILDVPDIIFKVEQDVDGDGHMETVYDEGYLDVNWDMGEDTSNVVIEAWENAISGPCGRPYEPCTTSGIVGINDMVVDPAYLSAEGYAIRVNRPKPAAGPPRPPAETPFCGTLRIHGCPEYGTATHYRMFYNRDNTSDTIFKESWYVSHLVSPGNIVPHHVVPDSLGFYPVLTPPDKYFPYHLLLNWQTFRYNNGRYRIWLETYSAANPAAKIAAFPAVHAVIDNSTPTPVDFVSLQYRELTPGGASGAWNDIDLTDCVIIRRHPNRDIELKVTFNAAAKHLRDYGINLVNCHNAGMGSFTEWHETVSENFMHRTWNVTVPGTSPEGGFRINLDVRSRAFNATGGLASDWYMDTWHIHQPNSLPIVILDM